MLAGVLLYRSGAACAGREREYGAVSGEVLALLLPVFYYVAEATVRDIVRDMASFRRVPQAVEERSIPAFDQGMTLEVMTDLGTVLLFGKLAEVSQAELVIERIPGGVCFPITEAGSAVLVRSCDAQLIPVILRAKVIRSSGAECAVGDLERIS